MDYEKIVEKSKEELVRRGHLDLRVNYEVPEGLATTVFFIPNKEVKKDAINALRKVIYENKVDTYILSMMAWVTHKSNMNERNEALIIIEFKKGDHGQYGILPFSRDRGHITFNNGEKSITTTKNLISIWNVFLETAGVEEHLKNSLKNSQNINTDKQTSFRGRQ